MHTQLRQIQGLLIMSIGENNQAKELGQLDTFGFAYEIAGKDNLLYVADAWRGGWRSLILVIRTLPTNW